MKHPCAFSVFLFAALFACLPEAAAQQHRFVQFGSFSGLLFPVSTSSQYGPDRMKVRPAWINCYDMAYSFPCGRLHAEARFIVGLSVFELQAVYSETSVLAHPELNSVRPLFEGYGLKGYLEPAFYLGKTIKANKEKNEWWEARIGTGVRFGRPRHFEGGTYQLDPLGNPYNYDLRVVMNYRAVTPVLYGGIRHTNVLKNGTFLSFGLEAGVPLVDSGKGWYRVFEGESIESGGDMVFRGTCISVRAGYGFGPTGKRKRGEYKQEIVIPVRRAW